MNDYYLSDAKYTCRGCLRVSEDLSTMTADEISAYRNYVQIKNTNTIMKICFICRFMFRKFAKFILQCQKSNEIMTNYLEEDHIFQFSNLKVHYNYVSTLPVIHYLGPEIECDPPNHDYDEDNDEEKYYDDTYKQDDEEEKYCDEVEMNCDEEDSKFDEEDNKFDEEDNKFDEVDKQIDEADKQCDEVDKQCDEVDKHDDDDIPLVLLKDCVKEEIDIKIKKKKKKRHKHKQVTQEQVKEPKRRSKVNKQPKEGFSSRMVQETNEYEVIKLTTEQVLQENEEKSKSYKYQSSLYKCEKCVKGFNFKDVLDNHMKKHSQEHGTLKCEICSQYCPSAVSLRGHMKSHTTRYKCKICGAVRLSRQHLLEHYTVEHTFDASVYTCEQCPFTTKSRTVIQRHVRSHKVGKSLTCNICGFGCSNMQTLRVHLSRHDPTKRFGCPQCKVKFIYPSLLHRHMRTHSHRDHYCVECDVTFKSIDNLKLHFKRAKRHRDPSTYKYKCSQCEERFVTQSALLSHLSASHGAEKTHACGLCGKLYSSRESVKSHERRAHARVMKFSCDVCHKEYRRKYVLAKHLLTHAEASQGCCSTHPQPAKNKKPEETVKEAIQTNNET